MKKIFKASAGIILATVLSFSAIGCIMDKEGDENKAPVVNLDMPYTIACVGDILQLPTATVTDEETLTATTALYQGEAKISDITDNQISVSEAGEYVLRSTAKDSKGLEGSAEAKIKFVADVVNEAVETILPVGGKMEIHLGAKAINTATGETSGTFNVSAYDYFYSDVANAGENALTVGTKLISASKTVDVTAFAAAEGAGYDKLAIEGGSIRTLRFTQEYLVNKGGDPLADVSSVVYFVENKGEAEQNVSLTVKNFVLGRAATWEGTSFRAFENPDDPDHVDKPKQVTVSDLKSLVDFSGETGLNYIRPTKINGKGVPSVSLTEDKKLRLSVSNSGTSQWHFFSWDNDVGVAEQALLKRDLSDVNYLVMVFEKDEGFNYENATICMYLQSDDWGVSYNLPCPYQKLNNMWFNGITGQDGTNKNLVYYYIPIKQCIEDEIIQKNWCANVDTLIIQMAGLPSGKETSVTVHGIYWC